MTFVFQRNEIVTYHVAVRPNDLTLSRNIITVFLPIAVEEVLILWDRVVSGTLWRCCSSSFGEGPARTRRFWWGDCSSQYLPGTSCDNDLSSLSRGDFIITEINTQKNVFATFLFQKSVPQLSLSSWKCTAVAFTFHTVFTYDLPSAVVESSSILLLYPGTAVHCCMPMKARSSKHYFDRLMNLCRWRQSQIANISIGDSISIGDRP